MMIPLTVKLDDQAPDYETLLGGFPQEPIATSIIRDVRLEITALDDARNMVLRYTGQVLAPITISVSQEPDVELIRSTCRDLAEYLGWKVVEP